MARGGKIPALRATEAAPPIRSTSPPSSPTACAPRWNVREFPPLRSPRTRRFLTARGNDYGFEDVFERLVDTLGQAGDALIAISTSGTSRNIVRAVIRARAKGILTVGLLGGTGGTLARKVGFARGRSERVRAIRSGIAYRHRAHLVRARGRDPLWVAPARAGKRRSRGSDLRLNGSIHSHSTSIHGNLGHGQRRARSSWRAHSPSRIFAPPVSR